MIEVREAPLEHYGWIASKANLVAGNTFRALEALDGNRVVGMVGYDGWTSNSCVLHIAIDEPIAIRRLLRPGFGLVFDLPPKGLGLGVVFGSVLSSNGKSLRLVDKLGFTKAGRLRDAWAKGVDMILFEMRREHCRWAEG